VFINCKGFEKSEGFCPIENTFYSPPENMKNKMSFPLLPHLPSHEKENIRGENSITVINYWLKPVIVTGVAG
jgi:hypothetical protein